MQPHLVIKPGPAYALTVSNTVTSFQTPDTRTMGAIITVEAADIRFNGTGANPSAGVGGGMPWVENSIWELEGRHWLTDGKLIRNASVDAVLWVQEVFGE